MDKPIDELLKWLHTFDDKPFSCNHRNVIEKIWQINSKQTITVTRCCEELPKTNCTLNRQTCGKGSGCKYPHCHL